MYPSYLTIKLPGVTCERVKSNYKLNYKDWKYAANVISPLKSEVLFSNLVSAIASHLRK